MSRKVSVLKTQHASSLYLSLYVCVMKMVFSNKKINKQYKMKKTGKIIIHILEHNNSNRQKVLVVPVGVALRLLKMLFLWELH